MSIASVEKVPADLSTNVCFNTCQVNLDLLATPLSSAQRDASITAETGMIIYNSTEGGLQVYTGSSWDTVPAGGTGVAPFYDRRSIQSTVTGIWTVPPGVQVDAQRSGDVCVLTITAATGFDNINPPIINGGTAEGGTETGSISIAALPASIYAPQNGNSTSVPVQTISGGDITDQEGLAYMNAAGTTISVIWPANATGVSGFYYFWLTYMGVPIA